MTRPHYDGKAASWREVYASADPYARRIQRRKEAVVQAVRWKTGGQPARVLDVGCGTGEIARSLAALGHSVVGVEASREMLMEARRTSSSGIPAPIYVRGSALSLPLETAAFDGAICVGVLEHMLRRPAGGRIEDAAAIALGELVRAVRPGGFLVITGANLSRFHWLLDPLELWRAWRQRRRARQWEKEPSSEPESAPPGLSPEDLSLTRRWTPGEQRKFLAKHHLEVEDCVGIGFGPFRLLGLDLLSSQRSVSVSAFLERAARLRGLRSLNRLAATWVLTLAPRSARAAASPIH